MSTTRPAAGEPAPGDTGPGYEVSDLKPRTIVIFGIGLTVVVAACLIVAVGLFGFFAAHQGGQDASRSPLARAERPAGPVLQVNGPGDLAKQRAAEDSTLSTYGWVDRGAGIVRIPIEQAMQRLVEETAKAPTTKAK